MSDSSDHDFYDSPYLAEHWDLVTSGAPGFSTDVAHYWHQLGKQLEERRKKDSPDSAASSSSSSAAAAAPLVVLDVGTGTGRILKGLDRRAREEGLRLPTVHLVGLDRSQHMLDRAAETAHLQQVRSVSWVAGSALDLSVAQEPATVDLLVMAAGSVHFLLTDYEARCFFRQVAIVLRPGSGRACVSFLKDWLLRHPGQRAVPFDGACPVDYASGRFPGVWYCTVPVGEDIDGDRTTSRTVVRVVRRGADGEGEETLERVTAVLQNRIWHQDHLVRLIGECGLEIVETQVGETDLVFVLAVGGYGNI